MTTGAGTNKVLSSDASGIASWQTPAGGSLWTQTGDDIYYTDGNVGIGTANPTYKLDVYGADPILRFYDTDDGNAIIIQPWVARIDSDNTSLGINKYSSESVNIAVGGGNVGIGTTTPGAKLDVLASSPSPAFAVTQSGTKSVNISVGVNAYGSTNYGPKTIVNINNPANASGKLTSVTIWVRASDIENVKVATFYVTSGNNLSTRSISGNLGTLATGGRTVSVDLDVEEGDYIGIYFTAGTLGGQTSGVRNQVWYHTGDMMPCTDTTFDIYTDSDISVYGSGTGTEESYAATIMGGNVGIGTTQPKAKLEVAGVVKIGSQDICNANVVGSIRYNSTEKRFEGCNGVSWERFAINSQPPCGNTVTFTYKGASVAYGTVLNPATGECWMDRNLGASRVATTYNDSAAYGDLFQWGRLDDGHQTRTSGTTTILSSTDNPGHSNFIYGMASPYNWRSSTNYSLWQGVAGTNNPCPSGWRLPTYAEWEAEHATWSPHSGLGAFAGPLKFTVAGLRHYNNATLVSEGTAGYYWVGESLLCKYFLVDTVGVWNSAGQMAYGHSVRCIRD